MVLADASGSCDCEVPALVGVSPDHGATNTSTAVTADLSYAATFQNGPTYQLVLTPHGGGTEHVFDCAINAQNDCVTMVSGLPVATYDASVRLSLGGNQFDTNLVANAYDSTMPPATVTLTTLSPTDVVSFTPTNVNAYMTNGTVGGTYYLVLDHVGWNEPNSFACTYDAMGYCVASVNMNVAGGASWDAWIHVGALGTGYDSNVLSAGFTTDGGP
jgi:hypothetical protein